MSKIDNLKWCSNCLSMSTRPRISFDQRGFCNACQWMEEKKTIDWDRRLDELNSLLNNHRRKNGDYDVIVPVSGGKDGSYVAYNLKKKFNMNPLAVTVTPALQLELGEKNLKSFIDSGFDHVSININPKSLRKVNKAGFTEMGFPYYGWLMAIHTAVLKFANKFGVNLIIYGEDGEVEYGGSSETKNNPIYNVDYMKRIYLEAGYEKVLNNCDLSQNDLNFFKFPEESEISSDKLEITHWSYFENWDPYRNYLLAKKECGLEEATIKNSGTFTNFSQNDQALYALHTYLMYLKFGFGRANQDACIEIRRGAMDRSQAINLVRLYDGEYPEMYLEEYMAYYEITKEEFDLILDKWVNKQLFSKVDGIWKPNFTIN